MKVYRYLSHYELNAILSDNISSIGTEYPANEEYGRINNHHYKSGIKYLHFFKHKDEFCDLIILENSDSFNDNIKSDIENIVPANLMNTFMNFIKYIRALRTMKHNDNDYTRYTLDNIKFIKTQIFKDY